FRYFSVLPDSLKPGRLYLLPITADVIRGCSNNDLTDIRLFSQSGVEVPYTIVRAIYPGEQDRFFNLTIDKYSLNGSVEVVLATLPQEYSPVDQLRFEIDGRDFQRLITVENGNGNTWEVCAAGNIYDMSSRVKLRKTDIDIKKCYFRNFRITLIDPGSPVNRDDVPVNSKDIPKPPRISFINARAFNNEPERVVYDTRTFSDLKIETDEQKNSFVVIQAGLPLEKVYFSVESGYFMRRVRAQQSDSGKDGSFKFIFDDHIYHMPIEGGVSSQDYILGRTSRQEFFKFQIVNADNPPLNIREIRFEWAKRLLAFAAPEGGVKLYFGAADIQFPKYDIAGMINQQNWHKQNCETLIPPVINENSAFKPGVTREVLAKMEKWLLGIVILAASAGIVLWIRRLLPRENT
ncbi:MAG: hypothetical protein PHQ23_16395, partial [Candidatus Wallbacteria bacterium]|nr:hypothetical protein [Candidatus Wallbacteria bacterium]